MKILLTGATGYIGKRLLPVLVEKGYDVVCGVRDKNKYFADVSVMKKIHVIEIDLLKKDSLSAIPQDIDAAFYLVHSMSATKDYSQAEHRSAVNFRDAMKQTNVRQVIYLSGITNSKELSKHLRSRKNVEDELQKGNYALTTLRAGIIIGSGSASFEIIRDLVEKLPVMVAPKWINTRCQPIGISDVIRILTSVLGNEATFNKTYDIGGADILTYKEMLLTYAEVRGLWRKVFTIPVMTPKLSSYWLYFITSTTFNLASSLVESMKVEVVAKDDEIFRLLKFRPLTYKAAIKRAFDKIQSNEIVSSWKDSTISSRSDYKISDYIKVPVFGCFKDVRSRKVLDPEATITKIWQIGGDTGWYYANWLWVIRGFLDKLFGGVGLKRGRTNKHQIHAGDTLDFWRVLYASREEKRLILYAEMKLPGEAWLEFKIQDGILTQTATFRPLGLTGRLYWYLIYPLHVLVFRGMIKELAKSSNSGKSNRAG